MGGSFHSWKFLPILGELIVQMLEDELDEELTRRWAWDRPMSSTGAGSLFPRREWRDLIQKDSAQEAVALSHQGCTI